MNPYDKQIAGSHYQGFKIQPSKFVIENNMRSYERNPDDENRLFYVGATRTKENLHIIEPKKYEKGYML